jgi:hypothetical protein
MERSSHVSSFSLFHLVATLGIVEFLLHIVAEYHEDYDKSKKQVFADFHFLLFYSAILNAFQSVLLAFWATRISRKIWVETEMLELNHYVEIREEFQIVKEELESMRRSRGKSNNNKKTLNQSTQNTTTKNDNSSNNTDDDNNRMHHHELAEDMVGIANLWQTAMDRFRYPALKRRYDALLLQIRFHELRIHFLQSYKLPLKLKISDYLIRSEKHVLIHLVHISIVAWLLLTGVVNSLYFILGMVSY